VMKMAWEKFGKPIKGYQKKEIWNLILNCAKDQDSFEDFYVQYIAGKADLFVFLKNCLPIFGLELQRYAHPDSLTSELGILWQKGIITKVHPESPAYTSVMIGDIIDAEIGQGSILLKITRSNGKNRQFEFDVSGKTFYPQYKIIAGVVTEFREKWMN
jgi:predicted metalloprotease with PDZ domain